MKHYLGVLRYVAFFALLLLAPARTVAWPRAWVLLGVMLAIQVAGTWATQRANSGLLDERAGIPLRRDQALADKILLPATMLSFAVLVSFDGWDAFRRQLLGSPPALVSGLGLILFAAGWWLVETALRTNAFAVTVVRHQPERGQAVVNTGVYRVVRHPMYAGLLGVMTGMGLWLGTYAGVVATILPVGLLVARIVVEERVLNRTLPDYASYRASVRSRLIPGIW